MKLKLLSALLVFGISNTLASPAQPAHANPPLTLSNDVFQTTTVPLLKHSGPGEWDNYLTLNLPFAPVAHLFAQLLIRQKTAMTSRGEAHITVITPIEFWQILRPQGITLDDIQHIAESSALQSSRFEIVCLGQGELKIANRVEKTWFLVVKSADLLRVRHKIHQLFVAKGGKPEQFSVESYYPHITLGYTLRDLHESDGVIKDSRSCQEPVKLVP
jgi:2'-5' RNA ligase